VDRTPSLIGATCHMYYERCKEARRAVWAGETGFAGDIGQEAPLHALGHAARVTAVVDVETALCAN
jgi:hypothetical protein